MYRSKECVHFSQEWLQKSSEFKDFIRTQEDRPDVQGLKLNALLITPVQRIPRSNYFLFIAQKLAIVYCLLSCLVQRLLKVKYSHTVGFMVNVSMIFKIKFMKVHENVKEALVRIKLIISSKQHSSNKEDTPHLLLLSRHTASSLHTIHFKGLSWS
jgi:hypothetical protein